MNTQPGAPRSDGDLWSDVRRGDPAAFAALYRRHAAAVYNHAFRRTGSWARAEDITSVVFLETWRRRGDVEVYDDCLLPWLLGVANNVLRREARTLLRHRRALARLPASMVEDDPADGVAARLDDEAQMREVLAAMEKLPRVEQETVALCVWAGLTYAQAAVAMHVPIGTVRSRLARARSRLRDLTSDSARAAAAQAGESR